jgi:hypothetical protein
MGYPFLRYIAYLHDDTLPGGRKEPTPVASIVGRRAVFYVTMVAIINLLAHFSRKPAVRPVAISSTFSYNHTAPR